MYSYSYSYVEYSCFQINLRTYPNENEDIICDFIVIKILIANATL